MIPYLLTSTVSERKQEEKKSAGYTGPSVVSYELDGRKASPWPSSAIAFRPSAMSVS